MTEPYYEDESTTVYLGDCLDVVPTLTATFDLVFTSPPYNLKTMPFSSFRPTADREFKGGGGMWAGSDGRGGVGYDDHEDSMPWLEYVDWQHRVLTTCWDALTSDGAIFYNHKPRLCGERVWLPLELNPNLPLRQIIIWARPGGINFNPHAFVPTHEWVMVMAREDWRLKSRGVSGFGDVWRVTPDSGTEHPAPFPVGLPARAIEAAAPSMVLDPFMGSGTTLVAAKAAGVRAVGIEKTERYCEMAVKRLAQGALAL